MWVEKRKTSLPRNSFNRFRGLKEVEFTKLTKNTPTNSGKLIAILDTLSQPSEPLVLTGTAENPFPPGFVDLIDPQVDQVLVDLNLIKIVSENLSDEHQI